MTRSLNGSQTRIIQVFLDWSQMNIFGLNSSFIHQIFRKLRREKKEKVRRKKVEGFRSLDLESSLVDIGGNGSGEFIQKFSWCIRLFDWPGFIFRLLLVFFSPTLSITGFNFSGIQVPGFVWPFFHFSISTLLLSLFFKFFFSSVARVKAGSQLSLLFPQSFVECKFQGFLQLATSKPLVYVQRLRRSDWTKDSSFNPSLLSKWKENLSFAEHT